MIDVFNVFYEKAVTALSAAGLSVDTASIYQDAPPAFPHCSITEQDNAVYGAGISLDNRENYARVMLQVDVYSAKQSGQQSECKQIMKVIDECFASDGLTRLSMSPLPNYNRGIYRLTARYAGVVSKGVVSGNNTVHYVYAE